MTLLLALALLTRGQLVENIPCASDPAQTYTLYLPSQFTAERRWPLLLIFDPRGRATKAAEIFRPGAEANGWVLISLSGTRSDTDDAPNERAIRAILPELAQYAPDEHRIYAAGFSGTATVAWFLAQQRHFAGVIAAGQPWIDELDPAHATFAYWASAGNIDFNYLDAKRIARELARNGHPHHLEIFDGPHQWMPPELATRAIEWMAHPANEPAPPEQAEDRYEARTVDDLIDTLRRVLASEASIRSLGIPSLKKTAAQTDARGLAAQRILARLLVQTSFYLPEQFRSRGEFDRAATVLSIATEIKPDRADLQYDLARARARAKQPREALDALERAVALGFHDRAKADADEDLASIRNDPRYSEILARIKPPSS